MAWRRMVGFGGWPVSIGQPVGQVWFSEFASLAENTLSIDVNNTKLECKADLREVEIKL